MSRIASAFERARTESRKVLVAYLCAGDPSLAHTEKAVPALAAAGADIIELGVPFSDPIADGPVIQAAAQRALDGGTTPGQVLELVARLRQSGVAAPLVLMGYLNPIVAMGLEAFCAAAAKAGVDGLIVPDLPVDEADELAAAASSKGLDLVLLAAPTTTPERLARIGAMTRGFLYYVSVTGVTGGRAQLPDDLPAQLAEARKASRVPVAVGFGVSTPEQARTLGAHADAVVVGSALVKQLHDDGGAPDGIAARVRALAEALK
jgi:tryptophan synthase alpha chain